MRDGRTQEGGPRRSRKLSNAEHLADTSHGQVTFFTPWCFLHHRPLTGVTYVVLKCLHLQCPGRGESRWWSWRAGLMPRPWLRAWGLSSPGALGGGRGPPVPGDLTWGMLLQIQDIVRRRQLLTIFREGKGRQQDVDVAILQALLKGEGQRRGDRGGLRDKGAQDPDVWSVRRAARWPAVGCPLAMWACRRLSQLAFLTEVRAWSTLIYPLWSSEFLMKLQGTKKEPWSLNS